VIQTVPEKREMMAKPTRDELQQLKDAFLEATKRLSAGIEIGGRLKAEADLSVQILNGEYDRVPDGHELSILGQLGTPEEVADVKATRAALKAALARLGNDPS
jgi:hypothetical protein